MLSDIGLTMGACTLWEQKMFLDYTIEVEDKEFKVHKLVMASVSDYFKVMLTGGMVESQKDRVRLEQVDGFGSLAVSNIIEFIYTRDFGSPRASETELLMCAAYLQVAAAVEACVKLLSNALTVHNCFDILVTFQNYSLEVGIKPTRRYIESNIEEIMRACFPNSISYEALLSLLEFWSKSEYELFHGLMGWVHLDPENRNQYRDGLLSHVRFAVMPPEQLECIKYMEMYKASEGGWCELVDKADEYHHLPTHQKVLDVSDQSRVRNKPMLVSFYVGTESAGQVHLLEDGKSWQRCETPLALDVKAGVDFTIVVNNFLIVREARIGFKVSPRQAWYIFDPRTSKWSQMAQMVEPRTGIALAQWDKYLYALGGAIGPHIETDAMERYDFEANSWTLLPHKLPEALAGAGAAVIGDTLYVADTLDSLPRMDGFSLSTNTWQSKASPRQTHYWGNKIQKMALWGKEVLFIIDATRLLQWYSPAADQWSVLNCPSYLCCERERQAKVTILPAPNALYILVLPDSCHDAVDRVCAKWTFSAAAGAKRATITEEPLEDFPVTHEVDRDYVHGLLAIPPHFVPPQFVLPKDLLGTQYIETLPIC